MASTLTLSPDVVSEVIREARLDIGVMAMLAYEYVITLDQEVNLFWRRKKNGATVLFLLARYLALLSYVVLGGATFAPMSDNVRHLQAQNTSRTVNAHARYPFSCAILQKIQYSTQVMLYLVWALFSSLRALALSQLNWPLAAVVLILASGPFAVNAFSATAVSGANIPFVGCAGGSNDTVSEAIICELTSPPGAILLSTKLASNSVTSVSRACAIVGESLIILVTLRYTLRGKGIRAPPGVVSSLAYALTVNGTIYFLIVVVLSTLQLALTLVSVVYALDLSSDIVVFADPLTAILICRFLLDLQHANQKALDPALDDTHGDARGDQTLSLRFASRVLGSIGGSLPAAGHSTGAFEGSIDEEYVAEIQCGSDEGISGTEYSQDSGPGKV